MHKLIVIKALHVGACIHACTYMQIINIICTDDSMSGPQHNSMQCIHSMHPIPNFTRTSIPPPPSGADIQKLLSAIDQANSNVQGLLDYWRDSLATSLETAKKLENDSGYASIAV